MLFESKIIKIGEETAVILTTEMLSGLDARAGDAVQVFQESDGSLRIVAENAALAKALDAGKVTMDENSALLQRLAGGCPADP